MPVPLSIPKHAIAFVSLGCAELSKNLSIDIILISHSLGVCSATPSANKNINFDVLALAVVYITKFLGISSPCLICNSVRHFSFSKLTVC